LSIVPPAAGGNAASLDYPGNADLLLADAMHCAASEPPLQGFPAGEAGPVNPVRVIFAVGDPADPAWSELRRLLEGVNLAGRTVGAFSRDGEAETFLARFAASEPRTVARKGLDGLAPWALSLVKS